MEYGIAVFSIGLIAWYYYNKRKDAKVRNAQIAKDLKYQRHLRNVFDYQIQLYEFMNANDIAGVALCVEHIDEEMNKCNEILNS